MHFKRTFTLITITVAAFFIGFILQSYNLYRKSAAAHEWLAHTNSVINRLEDIHSRVIAMQEAHKNNANPVVRGFTDAALYSSLDTLHLLMQSDPAERKDIASLRVLVEEKMAMLKSNDGAYSKIAYVDGRIVTVVDRLLSSARNSLHERSEQFEFYSKRRLIYSFIGYTLLGIFLIASLHQVYRNLSRRITAEQAARREEARYTALVEGSGAALVGRIGNIAILYRRSRNKPMIVIPKG